LLTEPLPVHNILVHDRRLELRLGCQVEYLDCLALRFEGNDILGPVHNSTVRVDGPFDDFIVVLEINDDNLGLIILVQFLADADVVIRF
jgi:hypothetical protein